MHEVWKIRWASSDVQSGKRGGFRVIYALNPAEEVCYLLHIYAKPEKGDVTLDEIEALLAELAEDVCETGDIDCFLLAGAH